LLEVNSIILIMSQSWKRFQIRQNNKNKCEILSGHKAYDKQYDFCHFK
jgi:hypothetical protein